MKTIQIEKLERGTLDISRLIRRQTSNTRGIGGNLMPSLKKRKKQKGKMKCRRFGISQTERRIPDREDRAFEIKHLKRDAEFPKRDLKDKGFKAPIARSISILDGSEARTR